MKCFDIEVGPEPFFGMIAQIENLQLADLIAKALSRPRNITINFSLNRRLVSGTALAEVSNSLFARPTLGVNSCIDNQADRSHQL